MGELRSSARVRLLDLISEGEIEGIQGGLQGIYLNNTPIQNADGTFNFKLSDTGLIQTTVGTNTQAALDSFPSAESLTSVATQVTVSGGAVTRSLAVGYDKVRVTVQFPALIYQTNGAVNGTDVQYKFELQKNGGSWVQVVSNTVSGRAQSTYEVEHEIALDPAAVSYNLRMTRLTADSATPTTLLNQTWWKDYTLIHSEKLRYPNSALVGLDLAAKDFGSIPSRSYLVKGLKVQIPSNYNPTTRVYTGTWDGTFTTAWTDNPAWCFYDLLTNSRYGLGRYLAASQVDKWTLYTIGKICDGMVADGFGGTEPRFTCNLYLQSREEAFTVLQNMASIFRGLVFWSSGSVTAVQDYPTDPVRLFTRANVVDGLFNYQGTSRKARHNIALVAWNDPASNYEQKIEYVEDATGIALDGPVQTQLVAFGCTSRGQAHRVGRWLLLTERYCSETVTFRAGMEGAYIRPGDIINVQDADRAGSRLGGRLAAGSTTTSIVIDSDLGSLPAGTNTLSVVMDTGAVETQTISAKSGTTLTTGAFSVAPSANTIWILNNSNLGTQLFRVLSVVESEPHIYEVTAAHHEPGLFSAVDNDTQLNAPPTGGGDPTPNGLNPPSSLTLAQQLYADADGTVKTKLMGAWPAVTGADTYDVQWRPGSGNWIDLPSGKATEATVWDVSPGIYELKVRAKNGKYTSAWLSSSYTVTAKTGVPADVTGFSATYKDFNVVMGWTKVADTDLAGYEIRQGASWGAGSTITKVTAGTSYVWEMPATGTYTIWIKAQNTSGVQSTNAVSTSVTVYNPSDDDILAPLQKPELIGKVAQITGEQTILDAKATALGITTEKTAYDTSISTLTTWLGGKTTPYAWNNVTGPTSLGSGGGATLRTYLADVYTKAATLLNAIAYWSTTQAITDGVSGAMRTADWLNGGFIDGTKIGPTSILTPNLAANLIFAKTFICANFDNLCPNPNSEVATSQGAWAGATAYKIGTSTQKKMASAGYVTPTPTKGTWATSIVTAIGDSVKPTSTKENGFLYVADRVATTSGAEPTWPTVLGATVTGSEGIVWTAVAGWVFLAKNSGTSHAFTEPTWAVADGGTVIDNAGASQVTWVTSTGNWESVALYYDAVNSKSGTFCRKVPAKAAGTTVQLTPEIQCNSGEQFLHSAYLKVDSTATPKVTANLIAEFWTGAAWVTDGTQVETPTGGVSATSYTLGNLYVTAPSGATKVRFSLKASTDGTGSGVGWVWADEFYTRRRNDAKMTVEGSLDANKLVVDFATANVIRSTNYSAGSAGNAPTGFKLAGTVFTTTFKDGTTDAACQAELGGSVNIAGYKAAVVTDRVMTAFNRIANGICFRSATTKDPVGWDSDHTGDGGNTWVGPTPARTSGMLGQDSVTGASGTSIYFMPFTVPPNSGTQTLSYYTGWKSTSGGNGIPQVYISIIKPDGTLVASISSWTPGVGAVPASVTWTSRTVDLSSYISGGGTFVLKVQVSSTCTTAADVQVGACDFSLVL